jgi:hypothetical protein
MGLLAYFPLKKGMLWIFIALKNPSSLAGFKTLNHGSNGIHTNPYTIKDKKLKRYHVSIVDEESLKVKRYLQ